MRKALIVEKNLLVALEWKVLIKKLDFDISIAKESKQAFTKLRNISYDLIILDFQTCELRHDKFLEVLSQINNRSKIIITTTSKISSVKRKLESVVIHKVLEKPYNLKEELLSFLKASKTQKLQL